MPYKKETVRICVRHSGEKRNAARGEKQEFPGNLPGTAVLGPLHDWGEKFLVPVFGEDKKGLINDQRYFHLHVPFLSSNKNSVTLQFCTPNAAYSSFVMSLKYDCTTRAIPLCATSM